MESINDVIYDIKEQRRQRLAESLMELQIEIVDQLKSTIKNAALPELLNCAQVSYSLAYNLAQQQTIDPERLQRILSDIDKRISRIEKCAHKSAPPINFGASACGGQSE